MLPVAIHARCPHYAAPLQAEPPPGADPRREFGSRPVANRALHVTIHEVHPEPKLYACPDCGGRWLRGRPASSDPARWRAVPYLQVRKKRIIRTGSPCPTPPEKEEGPMPLEDHTVSSYALVERSRSSGTDSVAVISQMPGNADTVEVLTVDLPSDTSVRQSENRQRDPWWYPRGKVAHFNGEADRTSRRTTTGDAFEDPDTSNQNAHVSNIRICRATS
jgi:hypothetical protein